jgi:hypothetical protein
VAHLFGQSDRNSPFVTAGYSRFSSGDGSFNAFNFGVGADFWRSENGAVRVEFRDHVRRRTFGDAVHYFSIRAGVAFR